MKISKLEWIKLLSELNIPMNVNMLDDSRKRKNGTECIVFKIKRYLNIKSKKSYSMTLFCILWIKYKIIDYKTKKWYNLNTNWRKNV